MITVPSGVGSVIPAAELNPGPIRDSVWARWTTGFAYVASFRTARSALAALLRDREVKRAWLPAYVCGAVQAAVVHAGAEPCWYPTGERLRGETDLLESELMAGDAVLTVDYFGRSAPRATQALAARRRDVLWIEDCAQALEPDQPPFGDVLLYSPRKLFGVADGGLLVSNQPLPGSEAASDDELLWRPNEARASDPHGQTPERWFPAIQAREAAFSIDRAPMTARTRDVLAATPLKPEAEARRANWCVLAGRLADLALWAETDVDFAPLAYPVLAPNAAAVSARLAEQRIWCARHWPNLPSPRQSFPEAHALAADALSVPLDPRYGPQDMERVAAAVRAAVG